MSASAFYTIKDMVRIVGRCERWVREHQEQLPGYTRQFGGVLFLRAEVDAAFRLPPTSPAGAQVEPSREGMR